MVPVHGRDHLADLRPQGRGKRDGKRLDHGDVQAASAAGGGDLEADEPCTHDSDTGRVHQFPPQRDRVVQTAQHEQAGSWRDAREGPDARPRRDDQPVVVGERAIGKRDAPGAEVDRRRAHTKPHVERERVVPFFPAEKGLLRLPGALEHLFGERRAVVGAMRLLANKRQLTVEASVAQRLSRAQACERSANDHDAMQHGSGSLFDRNRARWTLPHGPVHLRAQTVRRRLLQDVQYAVVADLEYFRRCLHAEPMEVAYAQIDNDFHDVLPVCDAWLSSPAAEGLPYHGASDVADGQGRCRTPAAASPLGPQRGTATKLVEER